MVRSEQILLVCTGNTCRSPMAEVLLRQALKERGLDSRFTVASAGTAAVPGSAAADGAIQAMADIGLSLDEHRSSPLSYSLIDDSRVILTMTRGHKEEIIRRYPEATDRVYTLGEFAEAPYGPDWEVADPFGGSAKVYAQASNVLKEVLEHIADQLGQQSAEQKKGVT